MITFAVLIVLVLGTWGPIKRFRVVGLSPSELASKSLLPSVPDDRCGNMQRPIARVPPKTVFRIDDPLTADEVAIYKAVLAAWVDKSTKLNVADRTFALDRDVDCECLKGMDVDSVTQATRSFHKLGRESLIGKASLVDTEEQSRIVRLNDPERTMQSGARVDVAVKRAFANGLFRLSEIAFDKEHRRALVGYSLVCGSLCGNGGTWLFEKKNGEWKRSEINCGGWIS